MMNVGVLFCFSVCCCISSCVAGPFHASCKVDWKFGINCAIVQKKLVQQILAWNGNAGCARGGETCQYKLVANSGSEVKAKHSTPTKQYFDNLTFTFKNVSTTKCAVHGFSTSQIWYAMLDYGTNYCNLRNLMAGSRLIYATGFIETTSDSVCTKYSSHDCTKY